MSLVQGFVLALKTLTGQESRRSKTRNSPRQKNYRSPNAVALIITLRELFSDNGIGFVLENMEKSDTRTHRQAPDRRKHNGDDRKKNAKLQSPQKTLQYGQQTQEDHEMSPNPTSTTAVYPDEIRSRRNLTAHRMITYPEENMQNSSRLSDDREQAALLTPVISDRTVVVAGHHQAMMRRSRSQTNAGNTENSNDSDRAIRIAGRRCKLWKRKKETSTILLAPDNEEETVSAIRKVLKWSPRKRSLAAFAVPIRREEKDKTVAVMQNAINRVKEKREKKKRRFLGISLC